MNKEQMPQGLPRILLVDDDVALVTALKCALETQGYVVCALTRSLQAVEIASEFKPNLIVLDVMMPGLDGWEVLKRLRKNPSTHDVPVIMLTAKNDTQSKLEGFSLGADDYVTKPFGLDELRYRVAAILRRSTPVEETKKDVSIPVLIGSEGFQVISRRDIYFVEGIRNYTYIHTCDSRFLSRLALGAIEKKELQNFMRVHRSFIVNMEHVTACFRVSSSSHALRVSNSDSTEIPISRTLVRNVQQYLGIRE